MGNIGFAFLLPDEQLVCWPSTVDVQNGPGLAVYAPFVTRTTKRKGVPLDERQYMVVTNELTAVEKTVSGPQLYFPAPHETWSEERPKVVVEKNEYVQLLDVRNGEQRQERGPATVVPEPFETLVAGGAARDQAVGDRVRRRDGPTHGRAARRARARASSRGATTRSPSRRRSSA